MLVIGLTGGIGSGKSTVASVFASLGVPVFNSDTVTNSLYSDKNVISKVVDLLGNGVLDERGEISRKKIASIVFNSPELLKKLNNLLHPITAMHFDNWKRTHQSDFVLKESAILFETGIHKSLDRIITVIAPEELRMQRVLKRDARSKEEIQKIMNQQLPDKFKIENSDFIIRNDETESVINQVIKVKESISKIK